MAGFFNAHSFERGSKGTPKKITQCGKCGLARKCTSPKMPPSGNGSLRILFIGEAPDEDEDRRGEHFTNDGGLLLRDILDAMGVDLNDCWSTNAVICKAPKGPVEPYMISSCRPSILKTIKELKPNVIIPMGGAALESVLRDVWKKDMGPFARWVGWTIPMREYDAWLCPTYHPSHVYAKDRDVTLARAFTKHLHQAVALERTKPKYIKVEDLEGQVDIVRSTKRAEERLWELSEQSGIVAWDYETTGLKPDRECQKIVSISFCLNGKDTFAFMMKPRLLPALKAVLRSKRLKKVASNLKFEERWTQAKLGYGVVRWYWDTMLAAHVLDNRPQISSVKFQAFVLLGIPDYDNHIHAYLTSPSSNGMNEIMKLDKNDLLLYNGMDSLLEYIVFVKQKENYLEHFNTEREDN